MIIFLSLCKKYFKVGLSFFDPVEKIIDIRSEDIQMDFCVNPDGIKSLLLEKIRKRFFY